MIDINEIKKNYQKFDDSKIIRIAEYESKGLRDEIIPILFEEIENRKLGIELIEWVNAERRKLSISELQQLKAKVRNSICEICKNNTKLKGYQFETMTGILIARFITNYEMIVCEDCGRKKRKLSTVQTLLFGWLSARGLISFPFIMIDKIKSYFQEDKQSNQLIERFIIDNIGQITLGKDEEEVIQNLIQEYNHLGLNQNENAF